MKKLSLFMLICFAMNISAMANSANEKELLRQAVYNAISNYTIECTVDIENFEYSEVSNSLIKRLVYKQIKKSYKNEEWLNDMDGYEINIFDGVSPFVEFKRESLGEQTILSISSNEENTELTELTYKKISSSKETVNVGTFKKPEYVENVSTDVTFQTTCKFSK